LLLISQIFVQLALLGLILRLMWRERRRTLSGEPLDRLKSLLDESSRLSAEFAEQITRNVGLMQQTAAELDERIKRADELKAALEAGLVEKRQERSYGREDVVRLARAGYAAREIAGLTAIPLGEVELMINLDQAS
jgi:hypothetical protein